MLGLRIYVRLALEIIRKKAVDLAFDINRRRWLKKNLRNKILSSPLGNTKRICKRFRKSYIRNSC